MSLDTGLARARPDLGDFSWAPALLARRQSVGGPSIGAIVHTCNEERNLGDALASLGWVDRKVVVDMESTDDTLTIARNHGAEIREVTSVGYADPARNAALDAMDTDWIIVLDADERVTEQLAGLLVEIAASGEVDVVQLHWHMWIAGQFLRGSGWVGHYHSRFFRRGHVRWPERVHGVPEARGRVMRVPYTPETALIHFSYDDLNHFVGKLNRYTDKEADAIAGEPPMLWPHLTAHLRREFAWHYTPGLDGTLSAALAFSMLYYRLLAQAKHWERLGFPEVGVPTDAGAALRDLAHDGRALHKAALDAAEHGETACAVELARRSVREQLDLKTLNDFAVLCAQAGRTEQALSLLHACLALDEGFEAALENLAALSQQQAA